MELREAIRVVIEAGLGVTHGNNVVLIKSSNKSVCKVWLIPKENFENIDEAIEAFLKESN